MADKPMTSQPLVDTIGPEALTETLDWFSQCHDAKLQCWALLDRAFHTEKSWRHLCATVTPVSVYAGRYQNADNVAPHLLPIPIGDPAQELQAWLKPWIERCQGWPMVSYISAEPKLDLKAWLQARAQIQGADESFMLRWADTRCLPQIVATFNAKQLHSFLQGIEDWRYYNRQGALRSIRSICPTAQQPEPESLPPFSTLALTAEQQQHLLSMALPDTVSAYVAGKPEIFGKLCGQPSAIHACIDQSLTASVNEESPGVTHERLQAVLQALTDQELLLPLQHPQGTEA